MGIFSDILKKIGIGKDTEATASKGSGTPKKYGPVPKDMSKTATAGKPAAMSEVDVTAKLDEMAKGAGQELNWRMSIVDLLKLLDIDSSYESRKELAQELHAPADTMEDSARMNIWLHKAVMQKIAANGGRVPAELLD
jgi:hypothetical protein